LKIWKFNFRLRYLALALAAFSFILGNFFLPIKNKVKRANTQINMSDVYDGKKEFNSLSKYIFTDPIEGDTFFYPTIQSTEELGSIIRKLSVPIYDIDSIYGKIKIVSNQLWKKDIFHICFTIGGDTLNVLSYVKHSEKSPKMAFCLIPGSGLNPSSKIFNQTDGESGSDHNGDDILAECGDVYTLIKLNEDCLALQNGYFKINYNSLVPSMLNQSSAYSYHYLLCSIALTKYLKTNYKTVGVVGLSQGGLATLINTLATKPDFAIIASGYSILYNDVNLSSITQIIYPGISKKIQPDSLIKRISNQHTQFLFTYGKNDDDVYKIEAELNMTAKKFSKCPNATFSIHPTGHNFDKTLIQDFIDSDKITFSHN
jgi:hypothetical protein